MHNQLIDVYNLIHSVSGYGINVSELARADKISRPL